MLFRDFKRQRQCLLCTTELILYPFKSDAWYKNGSGSPTLYFELHDKCKLTRKLTDCWHNLKPLVNIIPENTFWKTYIFNTPPVKSNIRHQKPQWRRELSIIKNLLHPQVEIFCTIRTTKINKPNLKLPLYILIQSKWSGTVTTER